MKQSIIFYVFFLLVSCNTVTTDNNPEGMYTCKHEHEFAKTEDTILLTRINENYFKIIMHSGVIRKINDKILPKQTITKVWLLEFNNNKKVFTEMKTGKTLIWNSYKQILILGNREYKKQ